ncbi:membrane hypothetical protein [Xanthomonas citri pv. citri]|nr:membrane hypothetical protein [Xanthomonas citri pv. citri]
MIWLAWSWTWLIRRASRHRSQKQTRAAMPPSPCRTCTGQRRAESGARGPRQPLQRTGHFDTLEALDLVAGLDVVVGLHADTAFGTVAHFVDVFLEATQRFQLAFEHHDAVAEHADRLAALDHAFDDHAACNRAELRAAEHIAHLCDTDDLFADFHAEQTGGHLLHLIDHVIDDREVTQVDPVGLDDLARRGIRTHVEADDRRLGSSGRIRVGFGDAAHAGVDHVDADVLVGQRHQRLLERFHRALHVGLDHQVQHLLAFALAHLGQDVFHAVGRRGNQTRLAALGFALLRHVLGQTLVVDDHEVVASFRHAGQTQDLHRNRRARRGRLMAGFVEQRTHATVLDAAHQIVATLQRTLLHQHRRNRAAALVQRGFDDGTAGAALGHGLEFQHFGLQRNRVQQRVHAGTELGRHFDELGVATEFFGHHVFGQQLVLDPQRIRAGLVDLVDRHDQRHACRLGMRNRFLGLRHHAIVGGNHQHHDVGDLGATGTHRGKRGMAGRIQEADDATTGFDVVRTDVLGNAAGFAGGDLGTADVIQQRGLAVIDVTHDGDHRRTRRGLALRILGMRQQRILEVGIVGTHCFMAELFGHQCRSVVIDALGDGRHDAHLEQRLDHVAALEREFLRQVCNGDGLADRHFTHHRCGGALEAVRAAVGLAAATAAVVTAARGRRTRATGRLAAHIGTPCAIGRGQMQLPGEALGRIVVLDPGHHDVRTARLVLGGITAVVRTCRRCRTRGRRCTRRACRTRCGGRRRRQTRSRRRGRRRRRISNRGRRTGSRSGFLGSLALGFCTVLGGLLFLALALNCFVAHAVAFGQALLLFEVALTRFLELAQDIGAFFVRRHRRGAAATFVLGLHVGALLPHFHVDRGLGAAGVDSDFLQLAPVERDFLGCFARRFGRRFGLAVRATQEAKQFHLLGAGHDLVGTAELHSGLGQLNQQFIDRRIDQFGKLADGGLLRHSDPMIWLAPPRPEQGIR